MDSAFGAMLAQRIHCGLLHGNDRKRLLLNGEVIVPELGE